MKWSIFIKTDGKNRWFAGFDILNSRLPSWTTSPGWGEKFDSADEAIEEAKRINREGGFHIFVTHAYDYKDNHDHIIKLRENCVEIEL